MTLPKTPVILTANDLRSGEVVYWSAQLGWQATIDLAEIFRDISVAQAQASENDDPLRIVGPYLASVRIDNGRIVPGHYREVFRMSGPTNYFHGKQESR
jgi:hypothetical protein